MANADVRCGRCGAQVETAKSAVAIVTASPHTYHALPLCETHVAEVRLLLEHYTAHRVSVLPGNRLCLALTDVDITRPSPLHDADLGQQEKRRGSSLLVAEPAWFAGLPPPDWVATTALEMTWTCANLACRVEQAGTQKRTYARVRGFNALYAICPMCRERLGPDPEIEIE